MFLHRLPARHSSSGKRWLICGLGHRFNPHTMQSEVRYLNGEGVEGRAPLSTELRRLWMSKGRVIDEFLGYQKKKDLAETFENFRSIDDKRSALFDLLESFLTTKSPEGLRSSQLACRRSALFDLLESFLTTKYPEGLRASQLACRVVYFLRTVVAVQESNPCIIHGVRSFGVLIRYMQRQQLPVLGN
uniref:Uncharacterized protein n=1 Tax=Solanum tuberosum TaxID=4113 RepID=M1A3F3_SOLTU